MRTLTADTKIRIKAPRRELTGNIKIKLNQIIKDNEIDVNGDEHGSDGKYVEKGSAAETQIKGKHDWKTLVPQWLDFNQQKVNITVEYHGKRISLGIPEELLRDPNTQKMTDEAYKRTTKDLKKQIQYLKDFNFTKATPKDVSDALRIMGKVNAAAFKNPGNKRKEPLTEEEKQRTNKIYKQAKDIFVPRLVDYCIKNKLKVSFAKKGGLILFENPITNVQISFHGYKGHRVNELQPADKGTWTGVKSSYVYNDKKEADKLDPIVKAYIKQNGNKHLMIKDKKLIVKDMKMITFLIYWADGQYETKEFKTKKDLWDWWKEVDEEGVMPIEQVTNYYTDEVIEHY